MKIKIILPIIVLLAACSSDRAMPNNTTLTSESTAIFTALPSNTPTEIPSTPTTTPDPNAPVGTLEKDEEGEYIKMKNGDIARKVEYKTSSGEILWSVWAVEKTQPEGIPLINISSLSLIQTKLYVASDVIGGQNIASLTHINNTSNTDGPYSLDSVVNPTLYNRKNIDLSDNSAMNALFQKIRLGEAMLSFITSTGESIEMKLGPDTGFITIVVPYDSLLPTEENGVTEWIDPYPESRSSFRSVVLGVDKEGNAICLIASKKPLNELSDKLIRALDLFYAANIIKEEDQTTQEYSNEMQIFIQYADAKGDEKVPHIIITRNP